MWANGKNDGKKQAFVSPGLVIGRWHLWKRPGFALGGASKLPDPVPYLRAQLGYLGTFPILRRDCGTDDHRQHNRWR